MAVEGSIARPEGIPLRSSAAAQTNRTPACRVNAAPAARIRARTRRIGPLRKILSVSLVVLAGNWVTEANPSSLNRNPVLAQNSTLHHQEDVCAINWGLSDKGSEPFRQLLFGHNTGSYRQHRAYDRLVRRVHRVPVQIEERFRDDVSRTFIAVEEAMIAA